MAGYWILTDKKRKFEIKNTVYYKKWVNNTIVGAEIIMLLELFEVLKK